MSAAGRSEGVAPLGGTAPQREGQHRAPPGRSERRSLPSGGQRAGERADEHRSDELVARLCVIGARCSCSGAAATWLMQRLVVDLERIELRGDLTPSAARQYGSIAGPISEFFYASWKRCAAPSTRCMGRRGQCGACGEPARGDPARTPCSIGSDGRLCPTRPLFAGQSTESEMYGPLAPFDGPEMFAGEAVRGTTSWRRALRRCRLALSGVEIRSVLRGP